MLLESATIRDVLEGWVGLVVRIGRGDLGFLLRFSYQIFERADARIRSAPDRPREIEEDRREREAEPPGADDDPRLYLAKDLGMSALSARLFLLVLSLLGFAARIASTIGFGVEATCGLIDAFGVFVGLRNIGSRRQLRPRSTARNAAEARAPDPIPAGRLAFFRRIVSASEDLMGFSVRSPGLRGASFEGR